MTPEGQVKKDIKKLLDSYGEALYYFMPVQQGYGRKTVDFLICYRGIFIALEVKRPGGRPTKLQNRILAQVAEAGGGCLCADKVDYVQKFLNDLDASFDDMGAKIDVLCSDEHWIN